MTHSAIKRILLVEDDPDMRFIVTKQLKDSGFECRCAMTVENGLKIMRAQAPDLVLLDLGFSGSGGAEFLENVSQWTLPGKEPPPIIVMSRFNDKERVDHVMDLGACGFIAKPYNPAMLVSQIRETLL